MDKLIIQQINQQISNFSLPRYEQLPNIGLYIDQVVQIINTSLAPLCSENDQTWITTSMINNYTKQGLIKRPQKKRYDKEQIAYLIYICLTKSVMQIANIKQLINSQKELYDVDTAYDFFCTEFEKALQTVFMQKILQPTAVSKETEQIFLLRATVLTIAQQIYLNKYLSVTKQQNDTKTDK
jgi:DNA-binding transcriptional MerR regulator